MLVTAWESRSLPGFSFCAFGAKRKTKITTIKNLIHRQRSRHAHFFNQTEDLRKNGNSDIISTPLAQ
jgi:hypothetical protein